MGRLVFLSGQVALDAEGQVLAPGDVTRQAEIACERLSSLMAAAGGSLADVVKLTVFLTDMRFREAFAAVRDRFFPPPFPASTLVQVAGLAAPGLLVEVEAIAVLPGPR